MDKYTQRRANTLWKIHQAFFSPTRRNFTRSCPLPSFELNRFFRLSLSKRGNRIGNRVYAGSRNKSLPPPNQVGFIRPPELRDSGEVRRRTLRKRFSNLDSRRSPAESSPKAPVLGSFPHTGKLSGRAGTREAEAGQVSAPPCPPTPPTPVPLIILTLSRSRTGSCPCGRKKAPIKTPAPSSPGDSSSPFPKRSKLPSPPSLH